MSIVIESAATLSSSDWLRALSRVIDGEGVRPVFQPIIDLQRCTVVGYEALARFDLPGMPTLGPDVWFDEAERAGVGDRLDARVLEMVLEHRRSLPANCFLAVNVEPMHLLSPDVQAAFAGQQVLSGLTIELTEHHAWNCAELTSVLQSLRSRGAIIAIDDAGSGHSGLQQILQIRPSIVKLDRSLIAGIDRDEAKVAMVEMMGVFASRVDAWILAEGVETLSEARCLQDLGVPLVQGFYFGCPGDPWQGITEEACRSIGALARSEADPATVRDLVDHVAPLTRDQIRDHDWTTSVDVWKPVVDSNARPIGLVHAGSDPDDDPLPAVITHLEAEPRVVAYRIAANAIEPRVPVLVTDERGKYRGIISMRRFLRHLADELG